jgi:DNA-binding response OmpR family regulator
VALPGHHVPNRSVAPLKSKVLLVDDHPDLLKSVSRLLAFDFEVVAAASNGYEALDVSPRVDPDVIVLDVTMPGLDGFQTARELRRRGSRASIVYLTMHESEDFVTEGFRSGGQGYVLKTRVHVDLVNAVNHVLAGQAFVPSLKSLLAIGDGHTGHAAQFYADDRSLVDALGDFLHLALRRGDAVSACFSEPIRVGLAERLRTHGWNVSTSGVQGRFCAVDSAAALSSIMQDGSPGPDRVAEVVAQMDRLRIATAEGPARRMTLVGQIAAPLLASGNTRAALDTERLWNEQTRALPFLTVCCYPMTRFSDRVHAGEFRHMCAEHQAIAYTPDSGMVSLT